MDLGIGRRLCKHLIENHFFYDNTHFLLNILLLHLDFPVVIYYGVPIVRYSLRGTKYTTGHNPLIAR